MNLTERKSLNWIDIYNNLYINNNLGTEEIGKIIGMSRTTVVKYFRMNGLNIKIQGNSGRQTLLNDKAFDGFSQEMAYWLGFIAADGSVKMNGNCVSLILHYRDEKHLDKFRNFVRADVDFKRRKDKSDLRLSVYNENLKNSLINLGVVPSKTYRDIDFLSYVPLEYKWAFIFGYFDGDGCATFSRNYWKITIFGTKKLSQSILDFYYLNGIALKVKHIYSSGNRYSVDITKKSDVVLFSTKYLEMNDITLYRKREKIKQIILEG